MDCPSVNLTLGELHVSYTVTLRRPRIWSGQALSLMRSIYSWRQDYMKSPVPSDFWNSSNGEKMIHCTGTYNHDYQFQIPSKSMLQKLQPAQQNSIDLKMGVDPTFDWGKGYVSDTVGGDYTIPFCANNQITGKPGCIPSHVVGHGSATPTAKAIVEGATLGAFYIELPAQLAGAFTLEIRTALSETSFTDTSINPSIYMVPTGSLEPVYDMQCKRTSMELGHPDQGNGAGWNYAQDKGHPYFSDRMDGALDCTAIGYNSTHTNQGIIVQKLNFRAFVANSGQPNRIYCAVRAQHNSSGDHFVIHDLQVTCTRYNTTLNRSRDGSDDKPVLVDSYGQAINQ